MCGFIRPISKFGITLSLIVLAVAFRQTGGRNDLLSSETQARVGWGIPERAYGEARVLALGGSIDQALEGSKTYLYEITLNSGQYLRLLIHPWSIEVGLTLYSPDGQKLSEFACREKGLTPVSAIAKAAGTYRLEVRSLEKDPVPGRYELRVEEVRPATALDIHRVAAENAFANAEELRNEWKAESSLKAIKKYEEAVQHWRAAGEVGQEATALRNIGEVHLLLGEAQTALSFYQQALALSGNANDPKGETETLNGISDVYLHLGESQKAIEYCSRALNLSRANNDQEGEAQALNSTGKVYSAGFGDLRRAIEYYDQALARWYSLSNRRGQAEALFHFGEVYSDLGDPQKASDFLNRALSLFRRLSDRRGEALTLIAVGHVHSQLGEKQEALDLLNRVLALVRPVGDKRREALILSKLGWALYEMGEKQKSLDYYREALSLYQAINYRVGEAALLAEMGEIYGSSGESQKALDHYKRALLLSRAVSDRQIESIAVMNMGLAYESLGQKAEALKYDEQALSLSRACGHRRVEAYTLNNLGRLYEGIESAPESADYYQQALSLSRQTQDRVAEAISLYHIAQVERGRGHLTEARLQLEEALKIIESLRTKVASQELRSSYFASEHQRYDFYIDLLMQMDKQRPAQGISAEALQASERARARSLVESLAEAHADIRQGIDPALLERERSLQQSLSAKADRQMRLVSGKPSKEEAEALAKEIRDLTSEYDQVQAEIKSKSPRYAALTQPQPLDLEQIQEQVLDDNSLLLEYALGDERSYLWAVTKTGMTSYILPKRAEIEKAARHLYELLIARQPKPGETARQYQARVSEADAQYWPQAAALSQMVLGPVADQLGDKRLLIVSEGALQYLPFEALPVPHGGGERNKAKGEGTKEAVAALSPLVGEHEIVNLPSASVLALLRHETRDHQPASKAVAVIADPVFEADDPRVAVKPDMATARRAEAASRPPDSPRRPVSASPRPRAVASPPRSSELQQALRDVRISRDGISIPRLLSSRREADAIIEAAAGAGMKATDFNASRTTATSPELGQYRIVHFATHGLLNSEHPQLSGLVLSLVDEQGKPQGGFLRLHDIYNLNLPVDLVVLSACNTGLGKEVRGEGLVGIVRGFMYAGAARVIASLWKVDDEATAELMKLFYQRMLQDGMSPAAALRAAQVEMWQQKRWHSPYYWAAFQLQGEYK